MRGAAAAFQARPQRALFGAGPDIAVACSKLPAGRQALCLFDYLLPQPAARQRQPASLES